MKTILTLAFAVIFCTQIAHSQFTLKTDREMITINAGETATFTISFDIQNNFEASIFLALSTGTHQLQNGTAKLSADIVNAPYTSITLKITTEANFTKGGLYEFYSTGTNGGLSSSITCRVNVIETPRTNWRFVSNNKGKLNLVQQDANGYYWHGFIGLNREEAKTPLENWGRGSLGLSVGEGSTLAVDTKNNKMWFSSGKYGLSRYTLDGKNETVYNRNSSPIPGDYIKALALDNSGSLWVASDRGLAKITGNEWTVFTTANTNSVLGHGATTCLAISGSTVWVGTTNGLAKFDGNEWTSYTPQNSMIPAPFIRNIAVETNGTVWMGVSNDIEIDSIDSKSMVGLVKFDGVNWTLYDSKNSPLLKDNRVNSIAIDTKGDKWIATAKHLGAFDESNGAGILKFDNTTWTAYNKTNSSLPDNKIYWVGLDNSDNIWFTGINFWGVFNENGLPPFLAPPTGVEEQPEATDGITIYPNPSNTSFTISGADNILSVKLMNSLGIEVSRKSSVVSGTVEVDVADLVSGVYFVQLRTPTGMITKSIIVSR